MRSQDTARLGWEQESGKRKQITEIDLRVKFSRLTGRKHSRSGELTLPAVWFSRVQQFRVVGSSATKASKEVVRFSMLGLKEVTLWITNLQEAKVLGGLSEVDCWSPKRKRWFPPSSGDSQGIICWRTSEGRIAIGVMQWRTEYLGHNMMTGARTDSNRLL